MIDGTPSMPFSAATLEPNEKYKYLGTWRGRYGFPILDKPRPLSTNL